MTRKQVINYLRSSGMSEEQINGVVEGLTCEDAVSREAVLKAIEGKEYKFQVYEAIEKLPPVAPKQRTGKWFIDERPESNRETICSVCEQPIFKYHKLDFDYRPAYCPNCGAKMRGE